MEFAIVICSLFSACLGAAIGYAVGLYQSRKNNNRHGINIPDVEVEVPMPEVEPPKEEDAFVFKSADFYRDIAAQADENGTSDKMRLLKKISKEIDKAARRGWRKLKISEQLPELNKEIDEMLTKRDIYEYFCEAGYWVEFMYSYDPSSKINYISWDGRGEKEVE